MISQLCGQPPASCEQVCCKYEIPVAAGLSPNAVGIRSSSALRNACVSWAVEFGGTRGGPARAWRSG